MENRLVLFDFDGTLTRTDTFFEFIRFHHGTARFIAGFIFLSPVLALFKVGLIKNGHAKQIVLRHFFSNTPAESFNRSCTAFATEIIPGLIRPAAQLALREETRKKSILVVVSASPENWVKPWCDLQQIQCIGTQLEVVDSKITGNIKGQNCFGQEKVNRIKEKFSLADFSMVAAYGDSSGDKQMLELAQEKHWREL